MDSELLGISIRLGFDKGLATGKRGVFNIVIRQREIVIIIPLRQGTRQVLLSRQVWPQLPRHAAKYAELG